ncbi:hypothetical protein QBC37DRAFT_421456 [Rhypophila decipiens]|uniref:FAD-binding PCMH-type domain-containing protein n=1 Tax=Rhypophila decipiens TaxID=261697 RepID=A0AAN6Y810_9PEZI|nr:hypothetical protein QBC37DRAFT_421456 [Rhypophila decipiens]
MSSLVFLALLALGSTVSHAASILQTRDTLVDCLNSSLSSHGSVRVSGDAVFTSDTIRFSSAFAPGFRVVAEVANEHDVRASITCAKRTSTPFLFTGPRHGFYEGFGKLQNALEIYTGAFWHVDIDAPSNTMTTGGAAVFKNVSGALQAVGKNIPVGGGPCVGMVGATLGAGIGRLQGLYGLIADSLLSVRLMLPDTTVLEVSKKSNPELFWGLRGAGFNFGYVLNATYRVYDAPAHGTNLNADFEYPLNSTRAFYQALHDNKMPAPLCLSTSVGFSAVQNATTLRINAVYAGPEAEGRKAVAFLQRIPLIRQNLTQIPWNTIPENSFFSLGNQRINTCGINAGKRVVRGVAFNKIDVNTHVKMTHQLDYMVNTYPQMRASSNAMYFCATQAVANKSKDETAYPWRQAIGHHTWGIVYGDANTTDADIENIPKKMRDTIAASAGTAYLNTYIGFSDGDEPAKSIWSAEHLPRLAKLKKRYDPDGLFSHYHPIPV